MRNNDRPLLEVSGPCGGLHPNLYWERDRDLTAPRGIFFRAASLLLACRRMTTASLTRLAARKNLQCAVHYRGACPPNSPSKARKSRKDSQGRERMKTILG